MISKLKALLKLKIRLTKCCYLNICQQGIICGNGYLSVQTIRPIAPRAQPAPPAQPAPSASALNSVGLDYGASCTLAYTPPPAPDRITPTVAPRV